MKLPTIKPAAEPKAKQINVRLTAEQERAFRQHCIRAGLNTQAVVVAALAAMVEGFENNKRNV